MRPRIARACLIYTTLLCLCVSDGVGPRLVPYPASPEAYVRAQAATAEPGGAGERLGEADGEVCREDFTADDAAKKLPASAAPETSFDRSALARRRAAEAARPGHVPCSLSLRAGRAPPFQLQLFPDARLKADAPAPSGGCVS